MPKANVKQAGGVSERMASLVARDRFPTSLGIEFVEGSAGRARVRLEVQERHLNCNGACHGGLIFALADTAFGLASNSYGVVAAGIDAHITYHVAAKLGDVLIATASEVSRGRKIGVYRMEITTAEGVLIASFTGTVFISERANDGA